MLSRRDFMAASCAGLGLPFIGKTEASTTGYVCEVGEPEGEFDFAYDSGPHVHRIVEGGEFHTCYYEGNRHVQPHFLAWFTPEGESRSTISMLWLPRECQRPGLTLTPFHSRCLREEFDFGWVEDKYGVCIGWFDSTGEFRPSENAWRGEPVMSIVYDGEKFFVSLSYEGRGTELLKFWVPEKYRKPGPSGLQLVPYRTRQHRERHGFGWVRDDETDSYIGAFTPSGRFLPS